MPEPVPYAARADGVRLAVRVATRSRRTATGGIVADAAGRAILLVRLAAPPVEGAANAALIAYMAKALKLHQRDIVICVGEQSRCKVLHLSGEADAIIDRLRAWIGA
jgi:uncharacterized protein